MSVAAKLDEAIAAVCPIFGVSIGRKNDKATWRIDFKDEATAPERINAQAVLDAFDVVAADLPIDESDSDNLTKKEKAMLKVIANLHSMTGPQTKAAFKAAWDSLP